MGVLFDESKLARTYSHPSVADAYDIVEQYRQAMQFGPDTSSTNVARRLEIPRSRVRPWLDGSKPDCVHAIDIATDLGWLSDEWTAEIRALSQLCIAIFACGSIDTAGRRPSWTPATTVGRSQIERALETAGVGYRLEADGRTPELWPRAHSSVLGRTLLAAGAPIGGKTAKTVTGLPNWVKTAPPSVRADSAELLVRERGIGYEGKATRRIQSSRPPSYFRDVAALIEDVTGHSVTYSDSGVTISADAVRAFGIT